MITWILKPDGAEEKLAVFMPVYDDSDKEWEVLSKIDPFEWKTILGPDEPTKLVTINSCPGKT